MRRAITATLHWFKYIIAVFMMYAGVATAVGPVEKGSDLGFIYENRWALVLFGIVFFVSGLMLFVGKLLKMNRMVGHGLFMTYACFLFGFILNFVGSGWDAAWGNLVASFVVGGLYLRWKYHIYYYDGVDKRHKLRYSSATTE